MISLRVITVILTTACLSVKGQFNLCTITEEVGNIGYRFHDSLCNEYIQCHNDNAGNVYAVYMSCPYGQHWDQTQKRCTNIADNTCSLGTCVPTARLEDGGCRAYATCQSLRAYAHQCCREGTRYMGGQCVPDYTCTDPCPGECSTGEICRSYPHWTNPTFYYHYHTEENTAYERICPRGSHYDMVECGCVSTRRQLCVTENSLRFANNGFFTQSGTTWTADPRLELTDSEASFEASNSILRGNIVMGQPTVENPLVIRLGYRRLAVAATSQFQTLFLSNDCKGCNQLRIGVQNNRFIVTISKEGRDVAEISMETAGFNEASLVDAAVVYNGRELLAVIRSDNLRYMKRTTAPGLTVMDCGMQISADTDRFRGRLQYVAIFTCHQGGRVQSLFDLPLFPLG